MAYITVDSDLKPYVDLESNETSDDALLLQLVARSQSIIDHYCGRTFEASSNSTRYFDALRDVRGRILHLDADLCSINSITNGDSTTVSAGNYVTEPRNSAPYHEIVLKQNSTVSWTYDETPENAIAVNGKWAYSATAPDDIKQACVRLAAYLYRQKDNSLDLDRTTFVGSAVIAPSRLPSDVQELLKPYRRLS